MVRHTLLTACVSVSVLSGQALAGRCFAPRHINRKFQELSNHCIFPADLSETSFQLIRRLQNVELEASMATVATPLEFQAALDSGAQHIVIEQHLDFTQFQATTNLNWTAAFHVPEGIKSIQGNCVKPFPPQADLGFAETDADLLPQKAGQCLLTFTDSLLALQSTSGDMIMLENLYFRDVRHDSDSRILVALASGRKYDSAPVDSGKGMFLSHVTVQGTGYTPLRGLYTTGRVHAADSIFSHLGFSEGLPPVKVRFQNTTATFVNCNFQDNFSPNDFGSILVEDNAAVRLEKSQFQNNTPELLDAFSGGKFYSDILRSVWNNPTANYITTSSITDAIESDYEFLNATDPFLLNQEAQFPNLTAVTTEFSTTSDQTGLSTGVPNTDAPVVAGVPVDTPLDPESASEHEDVTTTTTSEEEMSPAAADGENRRRRRAQEVTSSGGRKMV